VLIHIILRTHILSKHHKHPMSSAEVEAEATHHYGVVRAGGCDNTLLYTPRPSSFYHSTLELGRLSPPNSSTSSTGQQSTSSSSYFLQTTQPSTPQDLNACGNGYFYSPAQTPYTLEGSPIMVRHNNCELSISSALQADGRDCGGGAEMAEWKSDANPFELLYPLRSAVFLKDHDLVVSFYFPYVFQAPSWVVVCLGLQFSMPCRAVVDVF